MTTKLHCTATGVGLLWLATSGFCTDQLEMQNGDRYLGQVLSVSSNTVVLQSEVLGRISLPRSKVASLAFGVNGGVPKAAGVAAPASVTTNHSFVALMAALPRTNTDASVRPHSLSANTDLARQIREQMLAGSPEAAGKFDELVNGLMTGKLNLNDLRGQARSSADQLRALKSELGPEVGDSLDAYLKVLDGFLSESAAESASTPPVHQPKTPVR